MTTLQHPMLAATGERVADQLLGWDHLEWWVSDARAAAAWLCGGFGFHTAAYAGPETGVGDRVSYLLTQGDIRFVVTAGLSADSEVTRQVLAHGSGVRNLAWRVADPEATAGLAARAGAHVVAEPATQSGPDGSVTSAAIAAYGDIHHVFVDRTNWNGVWGPGFRDEHLPPGSAGNPVGLGSIDHVVGNLPEGRLDDWVAWYQEVLGFEVMQHFDAAQIATQYSALRSTVVRGGGIVLPLNEPAPGLRKSQITEYLEAYGGPGVQHIAMTTTDIVASVGAMVGRGVRFLDMPATYYEDARRRCPELSLPWSDLERLGIEVDKDSGGYLLQIFSEMVTDRPTLFLEIIQREGANGFGEGNFKALFEAIEREQARRGHL